MKTGSGRNNFLTVPRRVVFFMTILVIVAWLSPLHADDDVDFVVDQVVVKIDPASGATIAAINTDYNTTTLDTLLGSASIYLLQIAPGGDVEDVVEAMQDDPRLLYAEPNFMGEMPEGDPSGTWAWGGLDPAPYLNQYAAEMLNLAQAHAVTQGAGVVVAVLDTGVQLDHPRLAGRFTAARYDFIDDDGVPDDEANGVDDDGDGLIDEGTGHGTHVAGIVNLVAPAAQIMPLRILDSDGRGNDFMIAEAIQYAAANGAEVINLSLGTPVESELLEDIIDNAVGAGIVIVGAAGNLDSSSEQYPAADENVLAVTAVGPDSVKSPFANYGPWVDIATPGQSITSAFPIDGYAQWSGTSMATAFVAGQAALIRSALPAATVGGVTWQIQSTAQPIDALNPGHSGLLGAGLADIGASLSQDCNSSMTVFADADAWIDQNSSSNNFGSDSILKVQSKGPSDNFRALVRFVLPGGALDGCVVESATLRLYAPSWTNGRTLEALRLAGSWSENSVTWNNQPATAGAAATTSSGSGYREWDVTVQVQAEYDAGTNHGFLIRDAAEGGGGSEQQFHSREKGETPPELVLTFTAEPPSNTTAPETTIDSGPDANSTSTDATFTFSANVPDATFACSLDGVAFASCASPQSYTSLSEGSHAFAVRAIDQAGNVDPTPAAFSWTVSPAPTPTEVVCGQALTTSVRLANDLFDCPGDGLVIGAHGITVDLDGHTIDGTGMGSGIRNDGFDSVTITNGTVQAFDFGVQLNAGTTLNAISSLTVQGNSSGLYLVGASGNTLLGNTISGSADMAIELRAGSNGNRVEGNTITDGGDGGILVGDSDNNELIANTVHYVSDSGIGLDNAHSTIVRGNDLSFGAGGIEISASTGNLIESNNASHSGGTGIEVDGGSLGNVIRLNTANDNSGEGIAVEAEILPDSNQPGNLLDGNTAGGNQGNGIAVTKPGHTITANSADNNDGWGIYAEVGNADGGANTAGGNSEPLQCFNVACNGDPPAPPGDDPPDTTISDQPPDPSSSTSASFSFTGGDDDDSLEDLLFECRLDSQNEADFVACTSPQSYAGLSVGTHTFAVRAVDAAGNVDPTPATWTWSIAPPDCGPAVTVYASADAWIEQNSPSNNKGDDSILKVQAKGSGDNFRALVRFALPAAVPDGCVVESASLRLYADSAASGRTLQAMRLAASWSENAVTWNTQPTTTGPAATTSSGSGYREWDITAQVQAEYDAGANNGFLIRDAAEGGSGSEQQFFSREKGENPPQLVLTFAPAGG